jgi:hypothetical protein
MDSRTFSKDKGSKLGCFHGRLNRSMPGHHDNRKARVRGFDLHQGLNAVHVRHPDIQQDDVRHDFVDFVDGNRTAGGGNYLQSLIT